VESKLYFLNSDDNPNPENYVKLLVQGSAAEPYEVKFWLRGNNLTGHCSCPAGMNGQYCKHRFRVLDGNIEGVVSENIEEIAKVQSWLRGTDVEEALIEVREAEAAAEVAKRRLSALKKKLARKLLD